MFRKIWFAIALIATTVFIAASTQQAPARTRLGTIGQAPVVSDCPECQRRHPVKEVIQPIKAAVLPEGRLQVLKPGARIEAIKYDAKLDGKEAEEAQPCPCQSKAEAAGPRKVKLHGNRARFRLRGRGHCAGC